MSIMETLNTRRTYRRFAQKPVPQDVVEDMVVLYSTSNGSIAIVLRREPSGREAGGGAEP